MKTVQRTLVTGILALSLWGASFAQQVTLEFYNFFGADFEPHVDEINRRFEAEYPNIKIIAETADTGTFMQVLNIRLAANDAPDIFLVFPGTQLQPQADAGFLMPLNNEPWVDRVLDGALNVSSHNGNVYMLPVDTNVIAVMYNKGIFSDLGLSIPTTWTEFLDVAETIKSAGIAPLSLGLQSGWVSQLIPYAMAPTSIYRSDSTFDADMYQLEASFSSSPWVNMMEDYVLLRDRGYFQEFEGSTDFNLSTDIMASSEAAMIVQGSWALAVLKDKAPDVDWGMFTFPYSDDGQNWVATGVGGGLGIAANTPHPEEARLYLEFWSRPEIMEDYLENKGAFPVFSGLQPNLDPVFIEYLPSLEVGSYAFLDQNWPPGVQGKMIEGIQSVFAGSISIETMLLDMDDAWSEGMLTME